MVEAARLYLRGSSVEYLLISFTFCFLGYFNGREYTAFVMAQGLFSAFAVRVPLSYFLSRLPDASVFLISLAVPVSAVMNLTLCLLCFFWLRRRDKQRGLE